MSLSAIDVWIAASGLLKTDGHEAEAGAHRRAREFSARGDTEGEATWLRVLSAVQDFRRVPAQAHY